MLTVVLLHGFWQSWSSVQIP